MRCRVSSPTLNRMTYVTVELYIPQTIATNAHYLSHASTNYKLHSLIHVNGKKTFADTPNKTCKTPNKTCKKTRNNLLSICAEKYSLLQVILVFLLVLLHLQGRLMSR